MLQLFSRLQETVKTKPERSSLFPWAYHEAKSKVFGSAISQTVAGHHKVGFEDVLHIIKQNKQRSHHASRFWLLNTLPANQQSGLIPYTVPCQLEEETVNGVMNDLSKNPHDYVIVVYGKNNTDDTVDKKFNQLVKLGFPNVFIYYGGLFEWCLLQDVYGSDHFPTETSEPCDLLYWAPASKFTACA